MSSDKVPKSHMEMYKARTPPWKETYRKRCFDRLRGSRDKLTCRFRRMPSTINNNMFIEEIMKEELESLRQEQGRCGMDIENGDNIIDLNIDLLLDLFEDIQRELRQEELQMLEECSHYEDSLNQEEKSLCSAIDRLSTVEVLCPICKVNFLLANKSVIFCKCGLRINTEQDCLTLCNVKRCMDVGMEQHGEKCSCVPEYSVVWELGTSNLLMTCPVCDWMSIVI